MTIRFTKKFGGKRDLKLARAWGLRRHCLWTRATSNKQVLTSRFGIQQLSSKGATKIRTIDDFTASGENSTTSAPETIRHEHLDDLAKLTATIHQAGHSIGFIKADFKSAFRTVPILPEHIQFAMFSLGRGSCRLRRGHLLISITTLNLL